MPALVGDRHADEAQRDPRTGRRGRATRLRRPGQPGHPRQPGAVRLAGPRHQHASRSGPASSRSTTATRPRSPSPPAHLHEVSGGRFRLGLGVSHAPAMNRLGIDTGKPLHDMREYVAAIRAATRRIGRAAADLPGDAARQDARPGADRRRRRDLGQRLAALHADAGRPGAGRRSRRLLPRQHGADGDRRRPRRGPGRPPANARPATSACPTTATTGSRRATWRRWRRSRRRSPPATAIGCRR